MEKSYYLVIKCIKVDLPIEPLLKLVEAVAVLGQQPHHLGDDGFNGHIVGIYEVGKRVKNRFRFLEAHDMTIEAVVTKIMWLLAQDCDSFDQLQQRFYRQVNFDTFYH